MWLLYFLCVISPNPLVVFVVNDLQSLGGELKLLLSISYLCGFYQIWNKSWLWILLDSSTISTVVSIFSLSHLSMIIGTRFEKGLHLT